MKILFATDGSPRSLAALSTLVGMLDRFREPRDIVLLNVHPPLPYRGAAGWVGKEAIERYYDEEGEAALGRIAHAPRSSARFRSSRSRWSAKPRRKSWRGLPRKAATSSRWARKDTARSPTWCWVR